MSAYYRYAPCPTMPCPARSVRTRYGSLLRSLLAAALFVAAVGLVRTALLPYAVVLSFFFVGVAADLEPLEDLLLGRAPAAPQPAAWARPVWAPYGMYRRYY